jgi:hypothetical protein
MLRNMRLDLVWDCLLFICAILFAPTLDVLALCHHEAVAGFFTPAAEGARTTSFEG